MMLQAMASKWDSMHEELPKKNIHDLHQLIRHGTEADVSEVLNLTTININTPVQGATALSLALYKGKTDIFKLILSHSEAKGIDINKSSKDDKNRIESPLVTAVRLGNREAVSLLLDYGADLETTDSFNHTALWMATRQRYADVVHTLLLKGANVNPSLVWTFSPLAFAVKYSSKRSNIAKTLIYNGAETQLRNSPSLLYCAIIQGDICVAKLLVEAGYNASKDKKVKDELLSGTLTRYSNLIGWLTREMQNPPSLQNQCRTRIRRTVCTTSSGTYFCTKIQQLPLPNSVIRYLILKDVCVDI